MAPLLKSLFATAWPPWVVVIVVAARVPWVVVVVAVVVVIWESAAVVVRTSGASAACTASSASSQLVGQTLVRVGDVGVRPAGAVQLAEHLVFVHNVLEPIAEVLRWVHVHGLAGTKFRVIVHVLRTEGAWSKQVGGPTGVEGVADCRVSYRPRPSILQFTVLWHIGTHCMVTGISSSWRSAATGVCHDHSWPVAIA